jgi:ubiquinone/menaquinone biosynthesis C-methylase UbiE
VYGTETRAALTGKSVIFALANEEETGMSNSQSEVKDREREFHNNRYGADQDPRAKLDKWYSTMKESQDYFKSLIRANALEGSRVLEYGCGEGAGHLVDFDSSSKCDFYGIDISDEAIKKAVVNAREAGFHVSYKVADAEDTKFESDYFDLVVGTAIIHHLDTDRSMAELSRITKPAGCCLFFEPLGQNPFINLYRSLTPALRSPDEHPLCDSDFRIMRRYFKDVEVVYFHCFSLAAVCFRHTPWYDSAIKRFSRLDRYLINRFSWFGKFCWYCVIQVRNPVSQ